MEHSCLAKRPKISNALSLLKALSDENRLKIAYFLKDNEKCVCEIVEFLRLPQNLVSHHLKVLREQNILVSRKEGLKVYYSLNKKKISSVLPFFNSLIS